VNYDLLRPLELIEMKWKLTQVGDLRYDLLDMPVFALIQPNLTPPSPKRLRRTQRNSPSASHVRRSVCEGVSFFSDGGTPHLITHLLLTGPLNPATKNPET